MAARPKIVALPCDSVGPEIMRQALRVVDWFAKKRGFDCDLQEVEYGSNAYRRTGVWLSDEALADIVGSDAVLFGSVGSGKEFESIPIEIRRRFNLIRVRREMGLYANLRPL